MPDREEIDRIFEESVRSLEGEYPSVDGKPHPVYLAMKRQLEALRNPDALRASMSRHHAGATVGPGRRFGDLPVDRNHHDLDMSLMEEWVEPYYREVMSGAAESRDLFLAARGRFTPEVIRTLLGDFDWSTRIVGAWFAAVTQQYELFPTIGHMLLQSEVCLAGKVYTVVLATWNPVLAIAACADYLRYCLGTPEFDFDQVEVNAALLSLAGNDSRYQDLLQEMDERWNECVRSSNLGVQCTAIDREERIRDHETTVALLEELRNAQ